MHNGISRLRKLVGGDRIEMLTWGYRLHADAGDLDLVHFEYLVRSAREAAVNGMAEDALAALDEAVGLWREPLPGNVTSQQLRHEAVPQLTGHYLKAVKERAELRLQLGHQRSLADKLFTVLRAHPFRERVVRHLMIAPTRSERQIDALAVCDRLRRDLNDELGIDPAPTLQELRVMILHADPGFGVAARRTKQSPVTGQVR
jgi:DNA-binding SARP family transcriptional activator